MTAALVYVSRLMRSRRLVAPLVLLVPLAAAGQASATEVPVSVVNFSFQPRTVQINPGDTVVWNFREETHTTKARGGQAESWDSGPDPTRAGASFRHAFDRPGRYQYVCEPHQLSMSGVVQVGRDEVRRSYERFGHRRRGSTLTLSFRLLEPAKVTVRLRGASRRTVTRRRLQAGSHSISVARLREGRYRGTVTFVDDFDKKSVARASTVIR
jgi:plastocyanin